MNGRGCGRLALDVARRAALAVALTLGAATAAAQTPAPSVGVSFGVDTTVADVGRIVRLVRAYLARPDSSAVSRGLWSTVNPPDRRLGDLAAEWAYQGFPATVVGVVSAGAGDSTYVVKLLHARASARTGAVSPLALQRLYAVRAPGAPYGWQLAGAFPRVTAGWERRTAGRITYHYAPGQRPVPGRAERAARYVDSVAALFDVPAPARIDYVVAASPDEYQRALGLDFFPLPSGPDTWRGGNAGTVPGSGDGFVSSGDPTLGEAYLHELTHAVLPRGFGGGLSLNEGVATWLAGAKGRPFTALLPGLAAYQRARPSLTLRAFLDGDSGGAGEAARMDAWYATAALLVDGVYRRGGVAGLRALRAAPRETPALLAFLAARIGTRDAGPALDAWWRAGAAAGAAPAQRR